MKKKFFVTCWNKRGETMTSTIVELTLERDGMSQGKIAMLIDDQLDVFSRLVNFWEI